MIELPRDYSPLIKRLHKQIEAQKRRDERLELWGKVILTCTIIGSATLTIAGIAYLIVLLSLSV